VRSFEVDRQDLNENQFSQEVFLTGDHLGRARITWTAGAFYLKEDNEFHWALRIFAPPTTQVFFQKTTSGAVYAQGTLPLTERLNITAGLRYTSEKKSLDAIQYLPSDTVPTQEITRNPDFSFADEIKANRTNWRAAIDYKLADRTMLYANAATGFRSGGFNGSARDAAGITSGRFGPESSFMTEAGVKTDLLERRLRINALYYYAKYTDLQQAIVNPDGSIVAGNVKADVKGVEAEITALPLDSLRLSASVGTADDSIQNSPRKIKDTPSLQYRLSALYTMRVGTGGGSMSIGADMSYSGKYFNDTNNATGTLVDPYYMWNGYLTYQMPDDRWKFTLAGFNLSDLSYPNHTFNIANGFISSVKFPITPRRFLFTAAFKY
jgi:iron complex outermembrane receptor protein